MELDYKQFGRFQEYRDNFPGQTGLLSTDKQLT